MAVQGEVVGEEAHLAADQLRHPPVLEAGQRARHPVPEQAVVDQHRVRPRLPGADEQLLAGRDAGHDLADLLLTLHLEAVRAVVPPSTGVEVLVEVGGESLAG